jgi:hypothetical protein
LWQHNFPYIIVYETYNAKPLSNPICTSEGLFLPKTPYLKYLLHHSCNSLSQSPIPQSGLPKHIFPILSLPPRPEGWTYLFAIDASRAPSTLFQLTHPFYYLRLPINCPTPIPKPKLTCGHRRFKYWASGGFYARITRIRPLLTPQLQGCGGFRCFREVGMKVGVEVVIGEPLEKFGAEC